MIAQRLLARRRRHVAPSLRCPGELSSVLSRRLVRAGHTTCPTCGRAVLVVQHPDGGPGAFLAEHDRWLS